MSKKLCDWITGTGMGGVVGQTQVARRCVPHLGLSLNVVISPLAVCSQPGLGGRSQ